MSPSRGVAGSRGPRPLLSIQLEDTLVDHDNSGRFMLVMKLDDSAASIGHLSHPPMSLIFGNRDTIGPSALPSARRCATNRGTLKTVSPALDPLHF